MMGDKITTWNDPAIAAHVMRHVAGLDVLHDARGHVPKNDVIALLGGLWHMDQIVHSRVMS